MNEEIAGIAAKIQTHFVLESMQNDNDFEPVSDEEYAALTEQHYAENGFSINAVYELTDAAKAQFPHIKDLRGKVKVWGGLFHLGEYSVTSDMVQVTEEGEINANTD